MKIVKMYRPKEFDSSMSHNSTLYRPETPEDDLLIESAHLWMMDHSIKHGFGRHPDTGKLLHLTIYTNTEQTQ